METASLWEILVPTVRNNGRPFRTRHHKEWDRQVRRVSGGLTIFPVAKGQWVSPSGKLYAERMIPVRILATRSQIEKIARVTMRHYDQLAVLAYKVSNEIVYLVKE